MNTPRALIQTTLLILSLSTLLGCASVRPQPNASAEEKRTFLFASAAEQAATGPKDCKLYVNGLAARLEESPYSYDVKTLYYCSLGAECHVVLKVGTGEEQFVSDNGTFIKDNVEELAEFRYQRSRNLSWRRVPASDAHLMLLAERHAPLCPLGNRSTSGCS